MRPTRAEPLARLTPPPLAADLAVVNKASQNLHAELLLRRVGRVRGTGSIADGQAAVAAMLERAGVGRAAWDLSDGSGMSTYNRLAPRGVVTFLRWTQAQPWGAAWRATLAYLEARVADAAAFSPDKFDEVLVTGCGSTYYLALAAAALLQELTGVRARALAESKAMEGELRDRFGDTAVGELRELLIDFVQRHGGGDELASRRSRAPSDPA